MSSMYNDIIKTDVNKILKIIDNFKVLKIVDLASCFVSFYNKIYKLSILDREVTKIHDCLVQIKYNMFENNSFKIEITTEHNISLNLKIFYEDAGYAYYKIKGSNYNLSFNGKFNDVIFSIISGKITNKETCEEFPDNMFDWGEEELFYWKLKNK